MWSFAIEGGCAVLAGGKREKTVEAVAVVAAAAVTAVAAQAAAVEHQQL